MADLEEEELPTPEYDSIIPYLEAVIENLKVENTELKQRIEELEAKLAVFFNSINK